MLSSAMLQRRLWAVCALVGLVLGDANVTRSAGEFSVSIGPNPDSWQSIVTTSPFACPVTSPSLPVTHSEQVGAVLSTVFSGSAIYVNTLLDKDRGLATITLDDVSVDVPQWSDVRSCTTVFSKTGLDPNAQHTIAITVKDIHDNSTKVEVISFVYTIPGVDPTVSVSSGPQPIISPAPANNISNGNSVNAGGLAGIAIGSAIIGGLVVIGGFLFWRRLRGGNSPRYQPSMHTRPSTDLTSSYGRTSPFDLHANINFSNTATGSLTSAQHLASHQPLLSAYPPSPQPTTALSSPEFSRGYPGPPLSPVTPGPQSLGYMAPRT